MRIKHYLRKKFYGRKRYQKLFTRLLTMSLAGLNIVGGGRNPKESGESFAISYVRSLVGNKFPTHILDLGAQGGDYIQAVQEIFGSNACIDAFEPNHTAYHELKQMFADSPVIRIHDTALSDTIGEKTLYTSVGVLGMDSLYRRRDDTHNTYREDRKLLVSTIDAFCESKGIVLIDLLKIDIEGGELDALKGAYKMLSSRSITAIQFEFSSASSDAGYYFRDLFTVLSPHYRIYRILQDGLQEIPAPSPVQEFLYTTNYLALLKEPPKRQ